MSTDRFILHGESYHDKGGESIPVFVPFSGTKLPDHVLLFEGHPDFDVKVSDDKLLEGILVTDNFFQLRVESIVSDLISG